MPLPGASGLGKLTMDLGNDGELSDVGVLSVWLSHCTRVEQVLTWRWELIRKCLYTCICKLGKMYLFIWKTCICSFGNCKFAPLFCQFFSSVLDLWKVGCKSSANTKFHRNLGQFTVNANNGNPPVASTHFLSDMRAKYKITPYMDICIQQLSDIGSMYFHVIFLESK